jgi:hypothetical protein
MPNLPLSDVLRQLAAALEDELDAARGSDESDERGLAARAVRVALELRAGRSEAVEELGAAVERLQAERDRALEMLESALAAKHDLEGRLETSQRSRKWALASRRRLRARLQSIERPVASESEPPAPVPAVRQAEPANDALRVALEQERIARAAAEASLAYSESDRQRLQAALDEAQGGRASLEGELRDARALVDDLQAEIGELWRVLRETRPGEPLLINVKASEGDRREGIERVQAKIIDARELFKRRSGRWPVAI